MHKYYKNFFILCIMAIPLMTIVKLINTIKINFALSDLLIPIISIIMLITLFKERKLRYDFPYILIFLSIAFVMLISYINAVKSNTIASVGLSGFLSELLKVILSGLYFYIGFQSFKYIKNITKIIFYWVMVSLFVSLIGIIILLFYYMGHPIEINTLVNGARSTNVFVGTLTDPNLAALYLSISFYFSLILSQIYVNRNQKIISNVAIVLNACAILLTISRGGIIGFTVSILIYLILNIKKLKKYLFLIPIVFIILLSLVNIDTTFFEQKMSNRFIEKFEQIVEQSGEFTVRMNLAKAAIKMGNDNFLIGVGRGNYSLNSGKYFINMGLNPQDGNYKNKIPHNTIAGIYAELGIIGLLLYLWIFIVLIISILKNLKNKKNISFQYIVISMLATIFIQGISINIENFRGLWFIAGLLLFIERNIEEIIINCNENHKIYNKKVIVSYFLISALIVVILYIDLGRKFYIDKKIILNSEEQCIDLTEAIQNIDNIHFIQYKIYSKSRNLQEKNAIITLDQEKNGVTYAVSKYEYTNADGTAHIILNDIDNSSKTYLKAKSVEDLNSMAYISDIYMIDKYGNMYPESSRYVLLPKQLKSYFLKKKLLLGKKVPQNNQTDLWNKDIEINFGNKILLKKVRLELDSKNYAKLIFEFKCLKEMDINYNIWLHGSVDDINILPEDRMKFGFANFDHSIVPVTSKWQAGNEYIHEYILPVNMGKYFLSFGFYNDKDSQAIYRLLVNGSNEAGIYIGIVDYDK